jgi:hypothetical protein
MVTPFTGEVLLWGVFEKENQLLNAQIWISEPEQRCNFGNCRPVAVMGNKSLVSFAISPDQSRVSKNNNVKSCTS